MMIVYSVFQKIIVIKLNKKINKFPSNKEYYNDLFLEYVLLDIYIKQKNNDNVSNILVYMFVILINNNI